MGLLAAVTEQRYFVTFIRNVSELLGEQLAVGGEEGGGEQKYQEK